MQIQRHQDIITILEYRKIVEKGTIALAVLRITTQDLEYLEETYATMKACTAEPEKHAKADHLFHYRLAQIAHNPIILKVYAIIDEIMSRAMVDIVKLLGCEIGLRYHRKLIDALKSGDASACEALMAAHIEETIQAVLRAKETVTARTEQEPASS
jgi:GntR family transcriptional repressor for pyruvate dehydrogenase complex